ncbi:MAG TPA: sodium:solute symporter family protein [Burkholderiaceae bacterium]|nr:sodium:solute symporter family protein [Burkholderiaceae bacterium]
MLVTFVALYLLVTIGIGWWAARRVSNAADYFAAGHSLPLYMNFATVFATWFGAETVLAVSSTFVRDGLSGVVADPFGAATCLVIVALVFARRFYRLNLLTIGDFYRKRYNKTVEVGTGVAITLSYLGWASANLMALGICFNVLTRGGLSIDQGIMLGAAVLLVYVLFGGMFAVAFTDLFQTTVIIVGLLYIAFVLAGQAGGADKVLEAATSEGKLVLIPSVEPRDLIALFAAFVTMALGSIAQQDVFQRVTSAKDESTAVRGTLFGGLFYLVFAFVPMFIAVSALLIDPKAVSEALKSDGPEFQLILPNLILNHASGFLQVLFFGALLSAILSTASGAILAPTAIFTENILKPLTGGRMSDRRLLATARVVLVVFTGSVLLFALNSESSMYEMVQNAYKVTLVAAFTPLAFGMFWRRATPQGAGASIVLGLAAWIAMERLAPEALLPPQLVGLGAAIAGMVLGSLAPRWVGGRGHPEVVDQAVTGLPAHGHGSHGPDATRTGPA